MRKKNSVFFWIWTTVIIFLIIGLIRHFHIKNFHTIVPEVLYTSGQPRGMDYTRLLYKYHIAAFVNLRTSIEHRDKNWHAEEVEWMKTSGVKYYEVPMDKDIPSEDIPNSEFCKKFLEIMDEKTNYPVLLHDNTGRKRVMYLAAVWMLKSGQFDLEQTIKKIKQIRGEPPEEWEIDYLKSIAE